MALCHCWSALLLLAVMVISLGRAETMTSRLLVMMDLVEVKTSKVKEIEVLGEARLLVEVGEG